MATNDLLDRIAIDPLVCFGKPTIRGTRIWVGLVLGLLADGMTIGEVRACLAYGAPVSSARFIDVA
jgi:uncharacterized protein (DUF433 family)